MDEHRAAWDAHNVRETDDPGTGPLWIVLGDSSGQSVGASSYDGGWVGAVRSLLSERDGDEWRIVNHSVSGAKTADVLDEQLDRLAATEARLGPADFVSAIVGGNDTNGTSLRQWIDDADRLLDRLPPGALVATIPAGWREKKVDAFNDWLVGRVAETDLVLARLDRHTGPPYRGKYFDGFHPNDLGYEEWVAAIAPALGLS